MRVGRDNLEERKTIIETNYINSSLGSCLIIHGNTKVICTCNIENSVPEFRKGTGLGWLTAEYAMIPGSTQNRKKRDGIKKDGRSVEIQRLIGRSLRQCIDFKLLGEISLIIDCDVIQADGGTRTTCINGAFVALSLAIDNMLKENVIKINPIINQVAAISVGFLNNFELVDLDYSEDSKADSDINLVFDSRCNIIDIQGTAENKSFSLKELESLIIKARSSAIRIMNIQRSSLLNSGCSILPKPIFIVSTKNENKVFELNKMLDDKCSLFSSGFLGYNDDIVEDGTTFEENSIIKSKTIYNKFKIPTIADDSGLCVDALSGKPGIYSARYGKDCQNNTEKNLKLLSELEDIKNRNAHFMCCISLVLDENCVKIFKGECKGKISYCEMGNNGFGFDPIFMIDDERTFAMLSSDEKNKISHRGKSVSLLKEFINEYFETNEK